MTDKELLELAAMAAGINTKLCLQYSDGAFDWPEKAGRWNPLTDDGDALRLAVKLKLEIYHAWDEITQVCVGYPNVGKHRQDISYVIESYVEASIDAATRRAIVRAAAEIGKGMK